MAPVAVLVKGVLYILRFASLGAVAGHQEKRLFQTAAQIADIHGIGGAGHRAHTGVAVFVHGILAQAFQQVAHHIVDLAVAGHDILQLTGRRIGGFDQSKYSAVMSSAILDKGVDAVAAQIGVDGQAVAAEGLEISVSPTFTLPR